MGMGELRRNAEDEKYYNNIKTEFETLLMKIRSDKKDDLAKSRDEIKQYLEEEIASRYYFQIGRIGQSVKADKDIKVAIEVLSTEGKLKNILTTIEKPTKPFNPRKRF